jgi:CheY-like chemotaxis protein
MYIESTGAAVASVSVRRAPRVDRRAARAGGRWVAADRAHVLVVEDDESIRRLLAILLEHPEEYEISLAADGAEALWQSSQIRPTVVVLDLRLPRVDGLEVARRLRADPATAGCWIVAISAEQREDEALRAGCDRFLAKPLDLVLLEEAVRAGLARVLADRGGAGLAAARP